MSTNQTQEQHVDWLMQQSASCYATEMDLMHKIRDRITFVSGVLIMPISGAIMSLLSTYKWDDFTGYSWLFLVPIAISSILACMSLYFVFQVLSKKNEYKTQIFPSDLLTYYLGGTNHEDAIYETKYHLMSSYNDAVKNNYDINQDRLGKILNAQRAMTFAIPFLLIALPNYFYVVQTAIPETQSIKIENIEELKRPQAANVTITNLKEFKEILMSNEPQSVGSSQPQPAQPSQSPEPLLRVPTRPAPATKALFDSVDTPKVEGQQVLNEAGKG